MSNLFEALRRGQDSFPETELESLLEGQVESGEAPLPLSSRPEEFQVVSRSDPFQGALMSCRPVPLKVQPSAPILPFDGSHWDAGEQYRMLRTKLNQHPKVPQIVVVTSAGPSDGKSVTAINLAGALALKSEARILLIDGDIRKSTISKQLGLGPTPGLADVLTGACTLHEAMIQAEQIPALYVLSAGSADRNPAEILDSPQWHALIEYSRSEFQYIIIDSPPLGAVADYELIQAVADGAILVVRPDHTDRQLCYEAISSIPKAKLLGLVINCIEPWFLDRDSKRYEYASYYRSPAKRHS